MKTSFRDIFELKNKLWELRNSECQKIQTEPWTEEQLVRVLKNLKTNKTRDPLGMINEVFKPGIIGRDVIRGLLELLTG